MASEVVRINGSKAKLCSYCAPFKLLQGNNFLSTAGFRIIKIFYNNKITQPTHSQIPVQVLAERATTIILTF
jgi:hypothetical protein